MLHTFTYLGETKDSSGRNLAVQTVEKMSNEK